LQCLTWIIEYDGEVKFTNACAKSVCGFFKQLQKKDSGRKKMWTNERIDQLLSLQRDYRFACCGHMWDVKMLDQVVPNWYDAINSHRSLEHFTTNEQTEVDIPSQFRHL
jgi:hypothetical protein